MPNPSFVAESIGRQAYFRKAKRAKREEFLPHVPRGFIMYDG